MISSKTNQKIKDIVKLIKDNNERKSKGLFVIEGALLAAEAAGSGCILDTVLFTAAAAERYPLQLAAAVERAGITAEISEAVAGKLSSGRSTQGIFCVVKITNKHNLVDIMDKKRVLVLDSISEPSNLGAMARSAVAFGFDTLILSEDTSDWMSPRAQRAAMGALLYMDIVIAPVENAVVKLKENNYYVLAAAIKDGAADMSEIVPALKTALVIGNETNGLSAAIIDLCDSPVIIKTDPRIQSLNAAVAASILMCRIDTAGKQSNI